jgi:D-lactate dehydrogenase
MLPLKYPQLYDDLRTFIPDTKLFTDPLRTLAYGTDASFYRLIPKIVIKADSETEVARILQAADRHNIPLTFRAAGTSLSGQAVTDSVLVICGGNWNAHEILDNGDRIRLQPGVIGAQANRYLAPYGRKIGPDPASINAAMIGGIAANNASGMCCGVAQNSYQTIHSMRILLQDGTLLDTADEKSRAHFKQTHAKLIDNIAQLGAAVRADTELADRIRQKFKIKNTNGYSLNALVDFTDPIDILLHLMIGSEGSLGFISEITYDTVVEHPHKASALMIFPDIASACSAATILKPGPVDAVEIMDRAALHSVEDKAGMPDYIKSFSPKTTALLVETRAHTADELHRNIDVIQRSLADVPKERPITFTDKVSEYTQLWNIRKGLFPAVGAVREIGTTVIIEDVAFPIARLADATLQLQDLMADYRYHEAIIFGHAREGNLHFVFTQDFSAQKEVERYRKFMDEVCCMVVDKYDGSLKAEHGTGRNMAPYVEMEWGSAAYGIMQQIKDIFDPKHLLNPDVVINPNPNVHVENLKPLPQTNPIVDRCTECGFCEAFCPSRDLSLTPRQRIVAQREISRLKVTQENPPRLTEFEKNYAYLGQQTCAVDGMCAVGCPIDINTGEHTKEIRHSQAQGFVAQRSAALIAKHFGHIAAAACLGLKIVDRAHRLLGTRTLSRIAGSARKLSNGLVPSWNPHMPGGAQRVPALNPHSNGSAKVVYFPSCVSRTMSPAQGDPDAESLPTVTVRLLKKAGYAVLFPENMQRLCCGTPFESKGFFEQADSKSTELEAALLRVSDGGRIPVLCDTSPCLYRMRKVMDGRLKLFEPAEFIYDFLMERLKFEPLDATIALHHTCSNMKMALEHKLLAVAQACAKNVVVPELVGCCGFAGDRGFTHPELNQAALKELKPAVKAQCSAGYSTSRTCEIGLSQHSGLYYKSIVYLVDQCTRANSP